MKKKLLSLLTCAAVFISCLTGCNLIETDSKIDLAQVVATVGDENYKDEITKLDLLTVFVSQGSTYIEQGMSPADVLDGFYNVLVQRRILVQEAVKAIIEDKDLDLTLSDVLSEKEDSKVSDRIKPLLAQVGYSDDSSTNRLYNEAFNAAVEAEESQIKSQIDKLKLEDDEDYVATSTSEKTKRPVRSDGEANAPVAKEEFKYRNEEATEYGVNETDKAEKDYVKRAYKNYVSAIQQQGTFDEGKSWDYYINGYFEMILVEQLEVKLMEEHTRIMEEALIRELGSADGTDDEVKASELFEELETRYEALQTAQGQQFEANVDANISKIEGLSESTYLLYNATKGNYGFVRHILFKFDDVATLKVTEINSQDWDETKKLAERLKLAEKITVKDLREANEETGFPGANEDDKWNSVSDFMNFFNTAFGGVDTTKDNTYGGDIYKATLAPNYIAPSEIPESDTYEDFSGLSTYEEQFERIKDKFIDYEYAYSEDTASLGSATNMLLNAFADPFLSNQVYVAEFSEASRNVIQAGVGTYTTVVTDFGIHLILCADIIQPNSDPTADFRFNEALAVRVIRGDENLPIGQKLTDDEKNSAIYKIYQVLASEKKDTMNSDYTVDILKAYEDSNKVVRNESLMDELLASLR